MDKLHHLIVATFSSYSILGSRIRAARRSEQIFFRKRVFWGSVCRSHEIGKKKKDIDIYVDTRVDAKMYQF